MKLEDAVAKWNKMRGDNVKTNKIKEVDIDEKKEEMRKKKEAAAISVMMKNDIISELDEGVVV